MNPFRILVTGGREYAALQRIFDALNEQWAAHPEGLVVIEGGCPTGADAAAGLWARVNAAHNVLHVQYAANWKAYDRSAGPIRNRRMLTDGKPNVVLAFPGGNGTRHMVNIATKAGIPILHGDG